MVFLTIAVRNLLQARRRSLFLSLAIGLVTMMLVLLTSLAQGIDDNLVRSATTLSAGHVTIGGFYKASPGDAAALITDASAVEKLVTDNTPGLDYVVDRQRGWAKIISDNGSLQSGLAGIDLTNEPHFTDVIQLAPESDYKTDGGSDVKGDLKRLLQPNTAVLFAGQAKRLGVGVGDVVTLQTETMGGRTNTADVTVVAVAKDVGLLSSFVVWVPKQTVQSLYGLKPDTTGAIWIYLKNIDDAPAVMQHLREVLAAHGYKVVDHEAKPFFMKFETISGEDWTGQKLDVTTWDDEVSFLMWVLTAFDTVTWFLTLILVVIIAIGIMNTMLNSIRERTREIGTMRAIGMSRFQVLVMFMLEAIVLGLFATTMGASIGAIVATGLDLLHVHIPIVAFQAILMSDTLHLRVRPTAMLTAITALSLFTGLSALWPSLRAAWMRPVTAIQHVE